jgi:ATP-binding cassette subfamily B protein
VLAQVMYPVSCLTWSLSVVVIVMEARYASPTNWVSRSFWIASFLVASLLLWSNFSDGKFVASHDVAAFLVHYALYAGMAGMAVLLKEEGDYSQLAIDISEISEMLEDEQTAGSEDDLSLAAAARSSNKTGKGTPATSEWRQQLGRIWHTLADDQWLGAAAMACCFVGAPIEVVQFIYAGMVMDDCAIPDGPSSLGEYIAVLVALYLIEAVAAASQLILTTVVSERLGARLRRAAFASALQQEVLFVEGKRVEELASSLERDAQRVQDAATVQLCQVVHSLIQGLVGTVFLLVLSWKLTLIGLAILPVMALLMLVQSTVVQSYSRRAVDVLEQVSAFALEVLTHIRTVRSMGKEGKERARFGTQVLQAYEVCKRMGIAHAVADATGVLVLKLSLMLAIFYGASLVHHNDISGGVLASYALIAMQVVMAASVLPPVLADMRNAVLAARRLAELIDRQQQINVKGGLTLPRCEGRLELKDVSFAYPAQLEGAPPAVHRVNLSVEPGMHMAVVGAEGAGKSTLLALLERLVDPQEGLVLLDDTDMSSFDPYWLHYQVALIPAHPVLFSASVASNIAFGSSPSAAQVQQAASAAGVHHRIAALADGYDTELVPTHVDRALAQGIAVARAVLKDARILLIDDLLAAPPADLADARALSRAVEAACRGRTALSVARELRDYQRGAARAGVLRRGALVESGPMEALARSAALNAAQADGECGAGRGGGGGGGGAGDQSRALGLVQELEVVVGRSVGEGSGEGVRLRQALRELRASMRA